MPFLFEAIGDHGAELQWLRPFSNCGKEYTWRHGENCKKEGELEDLCFASRMIFLQFFTQKWHVCNYCASCHLTDEVLYICSKHKSRCRFDYKYIHRKFMWKYITKYCSWLWPDGSIRFRVDFSAYQTIFFIYLAIPWIPLSSN